jgi:hypothetical protein
MTKEVLTGPLAYFVAGGKARQGKARQGKARQGKANATLRVASEDVRTSETGKFVRKSGEIPYR